MIPYENDGLLSVVVARFATQFDITLFPTRSLQLEMRYAQPVLSGK